MAKKYLVTFRRRYIHRVVVGVEAPSKKAALQMAKAVYESNSKTHVSDIDSDAQLLYDNIDDAEDDAFSIEIQSTDEFPKSMVDIVMHG